MLSESARAESVSSTKRIARNTLLLYFRQILIMAVSLYTSRVTLAVLGISDFGIYNVIGGLVAMFTLVSGSMSAAISRFITIEVGKKSEGNIKEIFSTSLLIQIVISIIVIVLCEIAGTWFIFNKMNIPQERVTAGFQVMQCSLLTFVVNLLSIPYNAVIIAHERMSAFAYISILEVVLKLSVAFLLYISPLDKLIAYSILLFAVSLVIRLVYSLYCKRHFKSECTFSFSFNKSLFAEMRRFIGWAFFGNGIIVIKDYGTNILLNLFCGTAMNAARGVAGQVNNAAVSFVSNFMMAMNPQITKSYAEKDLSAMHALIIRGEKFGFFILLILFMLFAANRTYILGLWLTEVPAHTASLVVLILLYSLTETYTNPLVTGVLAEGDIRNYELSLTVIYALNIALSYALLKMDKAVECVFAFNIVFKMCVCVSLLVHSRRKYGFPIKQFIIGCALPTLSVFALCTAVVYGLHLYGAENLAQFVVQSAMNGVSCAVIIALVGMTKSERLFIVRAVKSKLRLA